MGIRAHSFGQLRERLAAARERLRSDAARHEAELFVSAPSTGSFCAGLGVVVLSPSSYAEAHRGLEALRPYLPALQALMVNDYSAAEADIGPVKCLHGLAWYWPQRPPAPPRGYCAVTTENYDSLLAIRYFARRLVLVSETFSTPTSLELAAECALLLSSLVRARAAGVHADGSRRSCIEFAENWLDACRLGLQATLTEAGSLVPAVDMVSRSIEEAAPYLSDYGAESSDLDLIRHMLAKRQTQADMQLALDSLGGDTADRQARRARATGRDDCFEQYLSRAPVLDLQPHRSLEDWTLHIAGRISVRYDARVGPVVRRTG